MHFEDLGHEIQMFKQQIGLEIKDKHVRHRGQIGVSNLRPNELTNLYMKQLNQTEIIALYKVYELDFRLFGYEYHEYGVNIP